MKTDAINTECLIIGAGIGGLTTAIKLAEKGKKVTVITAAEEVAESNTLLAQGGIIYQALDGDQEKLVQDILTAGHHSNFLPAVRQVAELGPRLVQDILLNKADVPFDRDKSERYHLTREAAHSENRILHRGDETGRSIEQCLLDYCKRLPITFFSQMTAVNLLMTSFHPKDLSEHHSAAKCFGAFVFDQRASRVIPIFAHHTVLATGGVGQIFLHNTNSKFSRGDGIALAYRAGCRLENLEYVQFHPTTFYHPYSRRFLISEALRGEGAFLVNREGKRFLGNYLQGYEVPELASRDIVAKGIHQEMLATGSPCVYLDISHKPADWIKERFPFVYRSCLQFGVDITKDPIPVVSGAHYHCGGVWVDLQGRTSIPNLWAVGEVACTGLHGVNRLASTSLLEGLVWGHEAGAQIVDDLNSTKNSPFPEIEDWHHETAQVDASFLAQDWATLKQTMWNYVGLIKTDARLNRAEGILNELHQGIETFYRKAHLSDALIGLRHASLVSILILQACKRNPRSLGCYLREDLEI